MDILLSDIMESEEALDTSELVREPPLSLSNGFHVNHQLDGVEGLSNYPPYNIARTAENAYRTSVESPASPTLISRSRRRRTG